MFKNMWNYRVDKILIATAVVLISAAFLLGVGGCSTQPMPNINVGAAAPGEDGTCTGDVTITIITGNDKAYMGDDGAINDDDGGQTPSLGL